MIKDMTNIGKEPINGVISLWIFPFLGMSKTPKKFPILFLFLINKIRKKVDNNKIIKYSSLSINLNEYKI